MSDNSDERRDRSAVKVAFITVLGTIAVTLITVAGPIAQKLIEQTVVPTQIVMITAASASPTSFPTMTGVSFQTIITSTNIPAIPGITPTTPSVSETTLPIRAPTRRPIATRTPTCPIVSGEFAGIWAVSQNKTGCAMGDVTSSTAAQERFQEGWMYWQDNKKIYVIYRSGAWKSYNDTWIGPKDYSCPDANTPQASPPTPKRGFGKIWCTYPEVRQGIGNAIDSEQGFTTKAQTFDNAMMISTDLGVWILYNNGSWERQ